MRSARHHRWHYWQLGSILLLAGLFALACALPVGIASVAPATETPLPTDPPTVPPPTATDLPPTATGEIEPSNTPQPTFTPVPSATTQPTPGVGDVILEDSSVTVSARPGGWNTHVFDDTDYTDVLIEADVRLTSGIATDTSGIICRFDGEDYYFVEYDATGRLGIWYRADDGYHTLHEWGPASAFETGVNVLNHIEVLCAADVIGVRVNDELVAVVEDDHLPDSTGLALSCGSTGDVEARTRFSSVVVSRADAAMANDWRDAPLLGAEPDPPTAAPQPTAARVATNPPPPPTSPPQAAGTERVNITNDIDHSARWVFWAGEEITVDIAPRSSASIDLPLGTWGWTSFLSNNCRLTPRGNLEIDGIGTVEINVFWADNPCEANMSTNQ